MPSFVLSVLFSLLPFCFVSLFVFCYVFAIYSLSHSVFFVFFSVFVHSKFINKNSEISRNLIFI